MTAQPLIAQQLRLSDLFALAGSYPGARCPRSGALITDRRNRKGRKAAYNPDWRCHCPCCGRLLGMTRQSRLPVHRIPKP